MSNPHTVEIRPLDDPEELHQAVELYRRVFRLSPTDPAIGPRLLAALRHNGGTVVGAFRANTLVGFVYGFLGMDPGTREIYHYSQTAAVAPELQGAGVGRALKLGQREAVLATGINRMRWSFDPLRAGNGHFNLDVLGARGRWFVPNLYGIERMGPESGLPSDRMIVDWDLTAPPPAEDSGSPRAELARHPPDELVSRLAPGERAWWNDRLLIGVPAKPVHEPTIREAVSAALQDALAAGWVAESCRLSRATEPAAEATGGSYVLSKEDS